jgi:hypothetical protein
VCAHHIPTICGRSVVECPGALYSVSARTLCRTRCGVCGWLTLFSPSCVRLCGVSGLGTGDKDALLLGCEPSAAVDGFHWPSVAVARPGGVKSRHTLTSR